MRWLVRMIEGAIVMLFGCGCSRADATHDSGVSEAFTAIVPSDASVIAMRSVWCQTAYLDLPTQRLSLRVDGAEPRLQSLGCRRLRVWLLPEISAELELYDFATEQGAESLLNERAGTERSENMPGSEGWLGNNVLYFRRGSSLVALIADRVTSPETLRTTAYDFDGALSAGRLRP